MIRKILNWWPIWFIRSCFCDHEYVFDRNFYGDQIIEHGFKRSQWYCKKCGRIQLRAGLVYGEDGNPIPTPETLEFINQLKEAEKRRLGN